jgi:chemotaxis protein CheX
MSQQTSVGLDATLVNALSKATMDVLRTMANTEVGLKEVTARHDFMSTGDISAIIGIIGEAGEGMVSLSFPITLATLLVSRLLGIDPGMVSSDERCDGIGEVINMICGNAKVTLSQSAAQPYKLSLPTIILGVGHEVASRPKNNPYLVMVFDAEGEQFHIQMTFKVR